MKTKVLLSAILAILAMLLVCVSARADGVPVNQYSKLIVGKWAVRELVYTFKKDGSYSYCPEGDEASAVTGTWKIEGRKLLLSQSDGEKPVIGIKFSSPDLWEWESRPGKIWDVRRITR